MSHQVRSRTYVHPERLHNYEIEKAALRRKIGLGKAPNTKHGEHPPLEKQEDRLKRLNELETRLIPAEVIREAASPPPALIAPSLDPDPYDASVNS